MVHFSDGPRLGESGQPVIPPALAHFRLYHVLRNGRQLRAEGRIQLLDDFFVASHLHAPSTCKGRLILGETLVDASQPSVARSVGATATSGSPPRARFPISGLAGRRPSATRC